MAVARKEWESFDGEFDQVLETVLASDIGRKVEALSTVIWTMEAGERSKAPPDWQERTDAQRRLQTCKVA